MKKIIVSLITLPFLLSLLSANASPVVGKPMPPDLKKPMPPDLKKPMPPDLKKPMPPEWHPPANCFISQGEKRCTSCYKGPSLGSVDINIRGIRTETSKTCEVCKTTIEPLVRRKACQTDSDCVLVRANCCDGPCKPVAIHKSQEGDYHNRLEKACAPPPITEDGYGIGGCMCGTMGPPPKYKAICVHFPRIAYEKTKKPIRPIRPRGPRGPRSECTVEGGSLYEVSPKSGSVQ